MYTITKKYKDFPAAHRQHNHDGHCAYVHGHNWSFELTFASDHLDENGFVMDFGKMKFIKDWLTGMFDHTLLINEDDPALDTFKEYDGTKNPEWKLWDMRVIPNGSAEDLAKFVWMKVSDLTYTKWMEEGNPWRCPELISVTVYEDDKNCATFIKPSDND